MSRVKLLPLLLAGSLVGGCYARHDIDEELLAPSQSVVAGDAGRGNGSSDDPEDPCAGAADPISGILCDLLNSGTTPNDMGMDCENPGTDILAAAFCQLFNGGDNGAAGGLFGGDNAGGLFGGLNADGGLGGLFGGFDRDAGAGGLFGGGFNRDAGAGGLFGGGFNRDGGVGGFFGGFNTDGGFPFPRPRDAGTRDASTTDSSTNDSSTNDAGDAGI